MTTRAIIFDCFGVLYHGSTGALLQSVHPDKQQHLHDAIRSFDYGYLSRDDFLAYVSELTGLTIDKIVAIRQARHVRNDVLVNELRRLKRTYKIGLLSNVGRDSLRGELFTDDEIAEFFDAMVLSSDVHIIKPDPAIFELMAARLGVLPEECIMIDDLEQNISGAAQAGMSGIVFASNEQFTSELASLLKGAS